MATFVDCCVLVIPFLVNFCAGQVTSSGDIRLRDGGSSYGRVEIFYNSQWGTVCDDDWDMHDAAVVCRQLGFVNAIAARQSAAYGQGEGEIWLDNVQCLGSESSLADCEHSPWGEHNCDHSEDAGVQCSDNAPTETIRLSVGGTSYGRVEIMHDGQWGTVCDDRWDMDDAAVVCRELGFTGAIGAYSYAYYGPGYGQIWLDDVECYGYESYLANCPHTEWGRHNCDHSEDAGVACTNSTDASDGEIRLRGGGSSYGRVEIMYDGLWGTVCDDAWDMEDAAVVCRQLGFGGVIGAFSGAHYGQGTGQIWLDEVQCYGYENQLSQCQHNDWGQHNCGHHEDAGVECSSNPCPSTCTGEYDPVCGSDGATYYNLCEFHAAQCENSELTYLEGECDDDLVVGYIEGDIRLVGDSYTSETGRSPYRGTIEVYHNGRWGTVCDDDWDIRDARVVCRQLGFPAALEALDNAYYGPGSGPISLDEVRCSGNEQRLVQCSHDDYHDCTHPEDAGVSCEIPDEYYPRLVGGYASYEGRLEVWNDYRWKRRCDYNFNPSEATVVCRQLGFGDYSSIYHGDMYSGGGEKSPPFDAYFICGAHEASLYSCSAYHITLDQSSCFSVSIRCRPSGQSNLSTGAIVGIVVGVLFGVVCLSAFIVTLRSAKKTRNQRLSTIATISGGDTHTATVRPFQPDAYAPPSYNDVMHNPMTYPYPPPVECNPAYPPPKPVVAHPIPPQDGLAGPPSYTMQTNVTYQPESQA